MMGKYNNYKEKNNRKTEVSTITDEYFDKEIRQKRRENKLKNKHKQHRNDYRWN